MVTIRLNIQKPMYCNKCPYVSWMYRDPDGKNGVVRVCTITKKRTGTGELDPNCPMEEE